VNRRVRLGLLVLVALLPRRLKLAAYRTGFGYRIGCDVRIGLSLLDAAEVEIGDGATIGHGNVIVDLGRLVLGDHVRIGELNLVRGGDEVRLGRYCEVRRRNELNSIVEPEADNPTDPRLVIGAGTVITDGHRLDFTDRIDLGERVIVGGRASSLWTHNRQRTAPIRIGDGTYLGSESRLAPGAVLPAHSIVGLASVVTGEVRGESSFVAGVPARVVRPLTDDDRRLVDRPTRRDLPPELRTWTPDDTR
jgi:acetyltransferase-like isoleucine patch superfamily enzyme